MATTICISFVVDEGGCKRGKKNHKKKSN